MDEKKSYGINLLIITIVAGLIACGLIFGSAVLNYKASNKTECIELLNCPMCGSKVKLYPINESWYIECSNDHCELHTGYFNNKNELMDKWNNMEIRK